MRIYIKEMITGLYEVLSVIFDFVQKRIFENSNILTSDDRRKSIMIDKKRGVKND